MKNAKDSSYVQIASRIELQQLRYFIAVAEQLNFSKAAEQLYVSQPLLSQQISALEEALGARLFERSTKAVSLAPAGEILLAEAQKLLTRLDIAVEATVKTGKLNDGVHRLQLLCDEVCSSAYFADKIFDFTSRRSDVIFTMRTQFYSLISAEVRKSANILGIILMPEGDDLPQELDCQELFRDSLDLILPVNTDGYRSPAEFFAESDNYPLLLPERDTRLLNQAARVCRASQSDVQIIFNQSIEDVIMNVELDNGFAMLPHGIAARFASREVRSMPLSGIPSAALVCCACRLPSAGDDIIDEFIATL
jgi:DNA-binding transcriptional LysR family regulator